MPATVLYLLDPSGYAAPGFHLFSGATHARRILHRDGPCFGRDTSRGRSIFGAGIGLLIYAMRTWGGYPDGVAFAVLLMNASVPLIDRYTRPRIYGQADGNPLPTVLFVAASAPPRRSSSSASYDCSKDRIAANERARVVARLNSVLDPSCAAAISPRRRLTVTDEELLGDDDPVDVFVARKTAHPPRPCSRASRRTATTRRSAC